MIADGLCKVYYQHHQGVTAENVAKKVGITCDIQGALAQASHCIGVGMRRALAVERA